MTQLSPDVLSDAKSLWDYHALPSQATKSDFILGLGSSDIRVAAAAADLMLRAFAPILIMSGGFGKVTQDAGGHPEAERFAIEAMRLGVLKSQILVEDKATNTGANFTNTRSLLMAKGITVREGIFVTKPYMKRRALATACAQWPEIRWHPYSPEVSFAEYLNGTITTQQVIELMVGDLQRIDVYGRSGFQVPQNVPADVWAAYERLVAAGFDRYLIRG